MIYRIRVMLMLAGILVVFGAVMPVQAATFTAGTVAELIQAIDAANDEATNPGVDTITLTADITLTTVHNTANGNNGLPVITSNIIIDGAGFTIERSTATGTPDFRILYVRYDFSFSPLTLTLNNVTLHNGSTAGRGGGACVEGTIKIYNSKLLNNTAGGDGGAIVAADYSTVTNSTFSGNTSAGNGGAIFVSGDFTVRNSLFDNNTAAGDGGGIMSGGGFQLVRIINSTFSSNTAAGSGGGIIASYARMIVQNSLFENNTAGRGGGVSFNGGTSSPITVSRSTFSNNTATGASGGGIFITNTTPTIQSSLFENNTAATGGGGISHLGAADFPFIVSNSTFSGNTVTSGGGGGIYTEFGILTLQNSTLSANSVSGNGGGLLIGPATSGTLLNSTVYGNMATAGGGVYIGGYSGVTFQNSIAANNSGGVNTAFISGPVGFEGLNIIDDASVTGSNVLNVNPNLAPLADNGGPTPTHALLSSSPAIDASGTGATATDQRGAGAINTRDIGAFEFGGLVPVVNFDIDEPVLTEEGPVTQATVTVSTLYYAAPFEVSFLFTGDVTPDDYTLTNYSDPLEITSGTQTFTIDIVNDTQPEPVEILYLEMLLFGPGEFIGATVQATVFDDMDTLTINNPDVNNDGIVSPSDAVYVLNRLGSGDLSADVSGDGLVNLVDYNLVMAALGN